MTNKVPVDLLKAEYIFWFKRSPAAPDYPSLTTYITSFNHTFPAMADIKPPFTEETALKKVKAAQDMWNTQYVMTSI